jgi:hypothetical protein
MSITCDTSNPSVVANRHFRTPYIEHRRSHSLDLDVEYKPSSHPSKGSNGFNTNYAWSSDTHEPHIDLNLIADEEAKLERKLAASTPRVAATDSLVYDISPGCEFLLQISALSLSDASGIQSAPSEDNDTLTWKQFLNNEVKYLHETADPSAKQWPLPPTPRTPQKHGSRRSWRKRLSDGFAHRHGNS